MACRRFLHFLFEKDFHGPFAPGETEGRAFAGGKLQRFGPGFCLAGFGRQIARLAWGQSPHQRAARDPHQQILAGVAVHAFALAVLAIFRQQPWLIILRDEIVQVVIGLQDHVAAAAAITASRAALGPRRLPQKSDTTFSAVTGARENFDFVDKHEKRFGGMEYWSVGGLRRSPSLHLIPSPTLSQPGSANKKRRGR